MGDMIRSRAETDARLVRHAISLPRVVCLWGVSILARACWPQIALEAENAQLKVAAAQSPSRGSRDSDDRVGDRAVLQVAQTPIRTPPVVTSATPDDSDPSNGPGQIRVVHEASESDSTVRGPWSAAEGF